MNVTQEFVRQYLCRLAAESKGRLTAHFTSEVEEMAILTSTAMQTLQNYHRSNTEPGPDDAKRVAFGLMTKGVNTLMAAFEASLGGYMWEPSILLRSALEGCATAWDLVHNRSRYELWKTQRKFDSTDSISNVRHVNGEIGRLYGYLSNFSVHTTPLNSSPSMVLAGDKPKFQFFGFVRPGKESVRKTEILFCLFVTYVCLQLTELVFHRYSTDLETIERIPETDLVRTKVSDRHRKMVDAMASHFQAIAANGSAFL